MYGNYEEYNDFDMVLEGNDPTPYGATIFDGFVPESNNAGTFAYTNRPIAAPHYSNDATGTSNVIYRPPSSPYRLSPGDHSVSPGSWTEVAWQQPLRRAPNLYHEQVPPAKTGRRAPKAKTLEVPDDHRPHQERRGVRCHCGTAFTGKSAVKNWRRHVEDVLFPDRYICPSCTFRCARRNGLAQHGIRNHGRKLLPCPVEGCYRMFANQRDLNAHLETH